jgi:hypothetical protein
MTLDSLWWKMPGPASYLKAGVEALEEGKNVLLCLPEHLPSALRTNLIHAQGPLGSKAWQKLKPPKQSKQRPIDLLFKHFIKAEPDQLHTLSNLASAPEFRAQRIWLEGIGPEQWPQWKVFLEEYEHICRTYPVPERSLFCVLLEGQLAEDPPTERIALAPLRWEGYVSELDSQLYTALIFQNKQLSGIKRRIAIQIIASLALWDPKLCQFLATRPLSELCEPIKLLQAFGQQRDWSAATEEAWANGINERIDGKIRQHSAYLAIKGMDKAVTHRVWRAQMKELYPYIEERRVDLLSTLQGKLSVPFKTREGFIINDIEDLEIGHIEWQLQEISRQKSYNSQIETNLQLVSRLKKMRNQLAHQKALKAPEIIV